MPKKKSTIQAPVTTVAVEVAPTAFSPAEAKKVVKLLKAADRSKRLDAIITVSRNHEFINAGGCLLPLLESIVPKKKMEDVVKAAGQVIVDYLVGRKGDGTTVNDNALRAMEQAKKSSKYKMADVLGNLVLNPDRNNSWNAVRSLRAMAAIVASLPTDSPERVALAGVLAGSGQAAENLCTFFVKQEQDSAHGVPDSPVHTSAKKTEDTIDPTIVPWVTTRLHVIDTLSVMCETNNDAVKTVVVSGAIPFLLGVLRWNTRSDCPDMPLLTCALAVLFSVAKAGAGTIARSETSSAAPGADILGGGPSRGLEALAEGGAWGTVYDALKGPIMARAAKLQSGTAGKKTDTASDGVISPDLAACLDNMGRCAEVLRVMAMTGAGLEQEGALEAGVAAIASIVGMQGLPRGEAPVANLMTQMVKAMGSIACLSETNRIKVCSAGAVPMVLSLMVSADAPAGSPLSQPEEGSPHGHLMRKTAEKCLHHLLVSEKTGIADDRALCDTSFAAQCEAGAVDPENSSSDGSLARVADTGNRCDSAGPPYLPVGSILAALDAESIDVRCRTIRLVSRLVSSRRNAQALGAGSVPLLARLVGWWLRTKDGPHAHRTTRPPESTPTEAISRTPSSKSGAPADADASSRAATATSGKGKENDAPLAEGAEEPALRKSKDNTDLTRVSSDEMLAHTFAVLLQLVGIGYEERNAIGDASVVELLARVLSRLPCTPEEFFSPPSDDSTTRGEATVPDAIPGSSLSPVKTDSLTLRTIIKHSGKPDMSLDLHATAGLRGVKRQMYSWRGQHGRDAEIRLCCPLDWDWGFERGWPQENSRPGLVLRAAVLRVLTKVVDGTVPLEKSSIDCTPAQGKGGKPNGGSAAPGTSGAPGRDTPSGENNVLSILECALPVCLDLLSVDVDHGNRGGGHHMGVGSFGNASMELKGGGEMDNRPAVSVETLLGTPVAPSEELLHADVHLGCLQLIGSLLRLEGVAREHLLSLAESRQDYLNQYFLDLAGNGQSAESVNRHTAAGTAKDCEADRPWVKQSKFLWWDFQGTERVESLTSSLPHVRVVSALLPPLRNPDAPIAHMEAALIALRRLCREEEHETNGTQTELLTDGVVPLSSSREGAAGALADTFAGVAVALGALVPLIAIRSTAGALVDQGTPGVNLSGIVDQCEAFINFLIQRGQSRESFWSSLPLATTVDGGKGGSVSASQKKNQAKPRGVQKRGKGGGREAHETATTGTSDATASKTNGPDVSSTSPTTHRGRPDPNGGPDRATWGRLLNSRVDERRTQTFSTTALLMATAVGLETAVRSLLGAGVNPNVRGTDGRTPIMYALSRGMDEAVRGLVDAGADVDAIDSHGCSVLKIAFLCPSRQVMQSIFHRRASEAMVRSITGAAVSTAADHRSISGPSSNSTRRGSSRTEASTDAPRSGRPRSRSRSGSVNLGVGRTRNRSGSLMIRRRSSLSRPASFLENVSVGSAGGWSSDRRRPSRTSSGSAFDHSCVASRAGRRGSMGGSLRGTQGAVVVQGEPRLIPYLLACGADPDVSSGSGDFPLHWVVTGSETTISIMNQEVKIVSRGKEHASKASEQAEASHRQSSDSFAAGKGCESGKEMTTSTGGNVQSPAASCDDSALLRALVEHGASLDACNKQGMSVLHAAVISDRPDLALELLDAGASPNLADSLGCLPLHYACLRASHGYEELARRLFLLGIGRPLERGAHRDLRKGKTRREKLLLDIEEIMRSGLREATAPSSITQHRATRAELLNYVSGEGLTPLHYACGGNTTAGSVVKVMRDRCSWQASVGPSKESASDGSSAPPGGTKILRWLLSEAEVDPKMRGPHGTTTLHLAAQLPPGLRGLETCRLLIQGGLDLDALEEPRAGDIIPAISCLATPWLASSSELRDPLVGNTADSAEIDGVTGVDAERVSAVSGAVRHRIRGTTLRFSALHYALKAGGWEMAEILLAAGASMHPEGASPPALHVACHACAPSRIVARLLDSGTFDVLHAGRLAGDSGRVMREWDMAEYDVETYAATPLFLAARAGSTELVHLLLPVYGHSRESSGGNISSSSRAGCDGTIREIASVSSDPWVTCHSPTDGRSPLHAAAAGGHRSVAQAILDGGAERWLNATDDSGCVPLDLAVANGEWKVAQVIASSDGFDIRLAIARGQSSALLCAERTNMTIVDEGSGEPSALSALRESNALIMILLERLRNIGTEVAEAEAEEGLPASVGTATAKEQVENRVEPSNEEDWAGDGGASSSLPSLSAERANTATPDQAPGTNRIVMQPSLPRAGPQRLPIVRHLHPCFAEGVLYSNAKGVRIPGNSYTNPRR